MMISSYCPSSLYLPGYLMVYEKVSPLFCPKVPAAASKLCSLRAAATSLGTRLYALRRSGFNQIRIA